MVESSTNFRFMEKTRLPSIDSFKMVLEFIHIRRQMFFPLLNILRPTGDSFYRNHVRQSPQFFAHRFVYSSEFQVDSNQPLNDMGWHPPTEVILSLGGESLSKYRLEHLKYCGGVSFWRLTFVFTGNVRSPPLGSYDGSPPY